MHRLVIGTLLLLLFVLQTTFLRGIAIGGVKPDLILIFVLYTGLFYPAKGLWVYAFLLGLLEDALSANLLGMNALSKGLAVLILLRVRRNLLSRSWSTQGVTLFGGTIFEGLVFSLIFLLAASDQFPWPSFARTLMASALYNAAVGLLCMHLFQLVDRRFQPAWLRRPLESGLPIHGI